MIKRIILIFFTSLVFGNMVIAQTDSAKNSEPDSSNLEMAEGQDHIQYSISGAQKFKQGDAEGGMNDFRKSVEVAPGYTKGFFNLGIAAYKMELYEEAANSFMKVLELDSGIMEAYYYLPYCFHSNGDIMKAEKSFRNAIDMFPGNKDLFYYLALIYSQEDEKEKEIGVYTELLDNFEDEYKALMNRGLLYNEIQEFEKAKIDFGNAILIDPTDAEPRVLRGVIYINEGNTQKGCVDLMRARELGDKSAAVIELIPTHCE